MQIEHAKVAVPPLVGRSQLSAGKWYRLQVVADGNSVLLYMDGNLESQRPMSFASTLEKANWGDVYMGGSPNGPPLDGLLDEVAFYSRAMSAAEIKASYEASLRGGCAAQ